MQGPRHLPTYIEAVSQERDLVKHYRKLEEIQQTRKKDQLDVDFATRSKIHELREKTMKFQTSEKALNIERENELLLGKLVEISRKKSNIFGLKNENKYGTLNAPARRREKDRIAQENEAFARRLLSQQPSFNRKKLEGDYVKHNERVKSMQKLMFSPKRFKLPPLKKEEFDTRKTKSGSRSNEREEPTKKKKKNNGSSTESRDVINTEQEKKDVHVHAHAEEAQREDIEAKQRKETEERIERERAEKEQAEIEKARKEQAEREHAEKEAAEKEAAEKEKAEQERIEKEKAEEAAEKKPAEGDAVEEEIPEDQAA